MLKPLTYFACALALAGCISTGFAQKTTPQIRYGRAVAAVNCGGCHAIGAGRSPLATAPAFAKLYRLYAPGGLDILLRRGLLPPNPPLQNGFPQHPRLASVNLDIEQSQALVAYLLELIPPDFRAHPSACGQCP